MLKIQHIDIVFQSVRILKTIKEHGHIHTNEFLNSSRQRLIHIIKGLVEAQAKEKKLSKLNDINVPTTEIAKMQILKILEKTYNAGKIDESRPNILLKMQKRREKIAISNQSDPKECQLLNNKPTSSSKSNPKLPQPKSIPLLFKTKSIGSASSFRTSSTSLKIKSTLELSVDDKMEFLDNEQQQEFEFDEELTKVLSTIENEVINVQLNGLCVLQRLISHNCILN
jgi:hypothetical protein